MHQPSRCLVYVRFPSNLSMAMAHQGGGHQVQSSAHEVCASFDSRFVELHLIIVLNIGRLLRCDMQTRS